MDERYDIKFFINNTDILVFRAFLVNAQSYRLIPLDGLEVNENYKKLFLRIIHGKYKVKYYDKKTFLINHPVEAQYIEINGNSAIENLKAVEEIESELVGVLINSEVVALKEMLAFRYEGYSLNLADGLLPKNANKVSNITTDLISTICANNTDFGEVFQMESRTGSTVIPFQAEKIDDGAIEVLIKIIRDINSKNIDIEYIRGERTFSVLYKKIIKKLKNLRTIAGLEKFEIIIDEERYSIDNLKNLDHVDMYSQRLEGEAEVRYYEGQLKSRKHRFVLVVVGEDGKDIRLHFDKQNEGFEPIFNKAKQLYQGKEVKYSGYSESEEVILIDELWVTN
jgi:hypothetical protein